MSKNALHKVLRRWHVVAAAVGVAALAGGGALMAAASSDSGALAFHTVNAVRILDTRPATQVGTRSAPLGLNETMELTVPGLPADASGVQINVTAVDGTAGSFLTVYPKGEDRPTTSTVNWSNANPVANMATVNLHSDQTLEIYNLKGTVNVVVDLLGYYAPSPSGGNGPAGPPGPKGDQGDKGDPGSGGAGVFTYASNSSDQLVLHGYPVAFADPGAGYGGIVAVPDLDLNAVGFVVPTDGAYKVSFGLVAEDNHQVLLAVNGESPQTGGSTFFGANGGSVADDGVANGGTAVLTLTAGDQLSVINMASDGTLGDLDLASPVGPLNADHPTVDAWILIEQLSSSGPA